MSSRLFKVLAALVAVFLLIQLVPYRAYNPEVRQEPEWVDAETRALAKRACFDCHSNQVRVPWYGYVAPSAWLVRYHVDEARSHLNFSEADRPQHDADEAGEVVRHGEMPPGYYQFLHPEAQLTESERDALEMGLGGTLGHGGEHDHEHDHEH